MGRDHSIECEVCGVSHGGLDDMPCDCDPTFRDCHDPVPIENCLTCTHRRLRNITRARDRLADLARTLAAGDFPPSAIEVHALIDELAEES